MSEEVKLYWDIDKQEFESIMSRLNQASIDSDVNDENRKDFLQMNNNFPVDEMYLEDGSDTIFVSCPTTRIFGKDMGYMSLTIPLSQELAIEIVDRYMKKLGKLKTVLEATK